MENGQLFRLLTNSNLEELQEFVNSNGKSKAYSPIEIIPKSEYEEKEKEREVEEDNG